MIQNTPPLAETLRPRQLSDVVGQDHLLNSNGFLTKTIASGKPASLIFWGPPGTGKTTLARIYANAFGAAFEQLSAVFSGVGDIKKIIQTAQNRQGKQQGSLLRESQTTVLFVDEIHRFNKAQQDAFLPYIEDGTIILVGATTQNPSFSLNDALLSRVQVLALHALDEQALQNLLVRAEKEIGHLPLTDDALKKLISYACGDGRYLLSMAEAVYNAAPAQALGPQALADLLQKRTAIFDRAGDGHYNLISALHKSVRGSDPDASLYWFSRMLECGEDPTYIARRLIRMAVEDIGLADPAALQQCQSAMKAYQVLGSPEGELALAQAIIYLAVAPKSNRVYAAYKKAQKSAKDTHHLSPPKRILNAPTQLMKDEGYGEGYIYDHDTPEGFSGQTYLPESIKQESFYVPTSRGDEGEILKRMNKLKVLYNKINESDE